MRIKKAVFLALMAAFLLAEAKAEDVKVSTYYPSPYGNYKELSSTSKTTLATDAADPNARVGIGTTNPTRKLDVLGSAKIFAAAGGNNAVYLAPGALDGGQSGLAIGYNQVYNGVPMTNSGFLQAESQGVTYRSLLLNPIAGNVGIGTAGPTQKLDVVGNIGISEGSTYMCNGVNVVTPKTLLSDYFFGGAGNLTMTGTYNTGGGWQALSQNTTGNYNTATGSFSLFSNTAGAYNTANGLQALYSNTSGAYNTANGLNALALNTTGGQNVANGAYAGYFNTTGASNVASGYAALYSNTTGTGNTADGYAALFSNTTGSANTAYGALALFDLRILNSTGSNTAIGYNAGRGITTGVNNTIIGANVSGLASNLSNNIIIADGAGNQRINVNASGNVGIGSGVTIPAHRLYVNGTAAKSAGGAAWAVVSDSRLKQNVASLSGALDKMLKLRGVTFEWREPEKHGNAAGPQMGMIAQEVEEVFPEWVGTDSEGYKDLTLSGFEALTVETIKEQQKQIEALKKRIEDLEKQSASSGK